MIMKQCSAGHFYDAERYDSCPYCGTNPNDQIHTQPNVIPVDNGLEPTVPVNPATGFGGGETIGLDMSKEVRPVVGWLVCIEGPDRGRSYEVHKENNYLGRSAQMDIYIAGDATISRDSPMVVTYDANSRSFYCGFMGGRSIVRLNGMPLLSTTQLKHGDIIELGKTKLMFVPFSSDAFDWDWTQE